MKLKEKVIVAVTLCVLLYWEWQEARERKKPQPWEDLSE